MQLLKNLKIENLTGKKKERSRYSSPYVYLDTDRKLAVATNEFALVAVPIDVDEGDVGGLIPVECIIAARKLEPCKQKLQVNAGTDSLTLTDGSTFQRPDGQFPPWRKIMPAQGISGEITIRIDTRLLWNLSQALGANNAIVTLGLTPEPYGRVKTAVRVLPGSIFEPEKEAFGLIMPAIR